MVKCRPIAATPTRYHRAMQNPFSPCDSITTARLSIPSRSITALWRDVLASHGGAFAEEDYRFRHDGVPPTQCATLRAAMRLPSEPDALAAQKHDAMSAYVARAAFPLMPDVQRQCEPGATGCGCGRSRARCA